MLLRSLVLIGLWIFGGCGACGSSPSSHEATNPEPGTAVTPTAEPAAENTESPPVDPPNLRLSLQTHDFGGQELHVENHGPEPAELRALVQLQVEREGEFVDLGHHIRLSPGANLETGTPATPDSACLPLIAGATRIMPPWDQVIQVAACPDRPEQTLGPGTYRYRVRDCGSGTDFFSDAWTQSVADQRPARPCPASAETPTEGS